LTAAVSFLLVADLRPLGMVQVTELADSICALNLMEASQLSDVLKAPPPTKPLLSDPTLPTALSVPSETPFKPRILTRTHPLGRRSVSASATWP